ncbi:MAG: efflux RND transporter periplasmic adaptor subunit [Parcubacteria group bacterium]|jgi:HlyD family secretion protein
MNKNIFSASLIAILVIGGIVASFLYQNMSKRPDYSTFQVKKGNIEQALNLDGKIAPQNDAELGFERGGKITKLTQKVGDFVKSGTVLAYANAADLKAQYNQSVALARSSQADVDQYQKLYKKEKAKLDSLKKTSTANSADKKAQKRQIEASEAQVVSQEEKVAAAFSNIENARAQIDKTVITAPFDGIVSKQDVEEGEVAQSNIAIITLSSRDSFKIEAYASEIDVRNIHVGDSAQVTLDDGSGRVFDAEINSIDPTEDLINNVSNYKVTLNFRENVLDLRSGVGASVSVAAEKKNDVLLVPRDAIFEEGGKKFVYISKNGLREKKEIQTGIYGADNMAEVASGLSFGDNVFELNK